MLFNAYICAGVRVLSLYSSSAPVYGERFLRSRNIFIYPLFSRAFIAEEPEFFV